MCEFMNLSLLKIAEPHANGSVAVSVQGLARRLAGVRRVNIPVPVEANPITLRVVRLH